MSKKKLENVNPDTLVVYIGTRAESDNLLEPGKVYTINYPCYGNFCGIWKPALYIREAPGARAFRMSLFSHVKSINNE